MAGTTLASIIYQVSTGGGTLPPPPIDPGNDPFVALLSMVLFGCISVGGGVLVFKLRNPDSSKRLPPTQPTPTLSQAKSQKKP